MSNNATPERSTPHAQAYPLAQRQLHAEQHIIIMHGLNQLEITQSKHIAKTYGLPDSFVAVLKEIKAKFRNELSFQGGDK